MNITSGQILENLLKKLIVRLGILTEYKVTIKNKIIKLNKIKNGS
jgi:hypothetical protein